MLFLKLFLLLSILSSSYMTYPEDVSLFGKEIEQVLTQRELAVNWKSWKRYQQTIATNRPRYLQEQKRWFADAIRYIQPHTYSLKLKRVERKGKRQVRVLVEQSYRKHQKRVITTFPLIFVRTSTGWRDSDFPFHCLVQEKIHVCYTDQSLENKAHVALDIARRARYVLQDRYDWHPHNVMIKLYHQPTWFRQSVKLSLPSWAGGWNEANQSIKLVTQQEPVRSFAAGIVHEQTHQMVSDLTNDNAAYWLQEGAAMYYEANLLPNLHEDVPEYRLPNPLTIDQLEKLNLEKLGDRDASRYYLSCLHWYTHLVDHYGEAKLKKLLTRLQRYQAIDVDSSDKIKILNLRTKRELTHVLGRIP